MAGQRLAAGSTFAISDGSTTTNASAVQTLTISGSPTSASLALNVSIGYGTYAGGTQTATVAYTATTTAAQIQTALVALPNIGNNTAGQPNVAVTGTAGGPYTLTFQNDLANWPIPLITTTGSTFTGGTSPSAAVVSTTPGTRAGGVYAALAKLTDMVFPNTKKDVKEVTNFDSAGYTKEYIGGFINPGDVQMNAMWDGSATQDWRTGIISKFYGGQSFSMRTNIPNQNPLPGTFTAGLSITFTGFFTDGSPAGAKHDDVVTVRGSVQISGVPSFTVPVP